MGVVGMGTDRVQARGTGGLACSDESHYNGTKQACTMVSLLKLLCSHCCGGNKHHTQW